MEQLAAGSAVLAHVSMGIALAASAGLRAFLPTLVVGVTARLGWVTLPERFEWLATTPALVVFGVALAAELAGDKLPLIDHLLDTVGTVVKPVAGAFVMLTVVGDWSPLYLAVVWIILGGALAGVVHVVKANLRLVSTAATGGLANPVVSTAEDLGALSTAVAAIVFPMVVALIVLLVLAGFSIALHRRRRSQRTA